MFPTGDNQPQDGHLLIQPAGDVIEGDGTGGQHCFVMEFLFLPHRTQAWHDVISDVLKPEFIREVHVYMSWYVQSVGGQGTSGAQASEL